jgi:hypothetical protein
MRAHNYKKRVFWFFAFLILTLYTLFVVLAGMYGKVYAYSQAIAENPQLASYENFVVVEDMRQTILEKLLARLDIRADRERMICGLSPEDSERVRSQMSHQEETIQDAGKTLRVYTPEKSMTYEELDNMASNVHCAKLSVLELIILIVSSQVS